MALRGMWAFFVTDETLVATERPVGRSAGGVVRTPEKDPGGEIDDFGRFLALLPSVALLPVGLRGYCYRTATVFLTKCSSVFPTAIRGWRVSATLLPKKRVSITQKRFP